MKDKKVLILIKTNIFMNWKRGIGFALLFIGIGLSFVSKTLTGAVIGFNPISYLGILGILSFIAGLIVLYSATLDEIIKVIEERLTPWQKEKFRKLNYETRKTYEKSYKRHLIEQKKKSTAKEKEYLGFSSLGEAAKKGKLPTYLAGKRIIFDTELRGGTYDKHTVFIGRKIDEEDFLKRVGREAQYSPEHDIDKIHTFEESVARKGSGYSNDPHKARVYGRAHSSHGGPPGAFNHQFTGWIAVELQEKPDGIHIHGYPVPEDHVPNEYKKK